MTHNPENEQPLPDISPVLPKNAKIEIKKGFDNKGRPILKALTTLQEVAEEHLYLIYRSYNKDVVVECDLLGDQLAKNSDGKLPPVIHLECPECSKPDKPGTLPENSERSILSISYGNKHYEIEDLERKDWGFVSNPDGSPLLHPKTKQPVIVSRLLTVKEKIQCVYCQRRFKITDNIMSPA